MRTLQAPKEIKAWRKNLDPTKTLGFVPTMGALHEGHLSLVEQSQKECDFTAVSIFVNPLQFNNADDLKNYPNRLENDLRLLEGAGVDLVWTPSEKDLYPEGPDIVIHEKEFSKILCGAHRPGHFDGVLTVVMKLLQIINPTQAFFGEKDHQQLSLIQKMVGYFFMDVEIVPCPTRREPTGLAMSSRNLLLTDSDRERASALYKIISSAPTAKRADEDLKDAGFTVDYVEDVGSRRYAAAWLGKVRLIDNVQI